MNDDTEDRKRTVAVDAVKRAEMACDVVSEFETDLEWVSAVMELRHIHALLTQARARAALGDLA